MRVQEGAQLEGERHYGSGAREPAGVEMSRKPARVRGSGRRERGPAWRAGNGAPLHKGITRAQEREQAGRGSSPRKRKRTRA